MELNAESRFALDQDFIIPPEAVHVFSTLMTCSNTECRETLSVLGATGYEEEEGDAGEQMFVTTFMPKAVFPAPALFHIPDAVPDNCKSLIHRSFALYWGDRKSAANALRAALEALLDDKGFTGAKLGNQIAQLTVVHPELKDYVEAIRMVGNHGSHKDVEEHSHEEMLDALEATEYVCKELYHDLKKKVGNLVAAKGKPKPKGQLGQG